MVDAKILLWDLETTHLKADFGTLLCAGYKWLGEKKIYVPTIADTKRFQRDPTDDYDLVKSFAEVLREADIWVTYFGKGFDVKFMQAKMLEHGLGILPNTPHVDLYFVVKQNLALSRKSLGNVATFLNFEAAKTPVDGRTWKKAMAGSRAALKYIVDHCRADVALLEEAYLMLRPLVRQHPRVAQAIEPCRVCGGTRLQRRGLAVRVTKGERYRWHCQNCGSWMVA